MTNTCGEASIKSFRLNQIGLGEVYAQATFTMYPNPASEAVVLEWDATLIKASNIDIIDVSGKVMLNPAMDSQTQGQQTVNVSALAEGYYMVRITTNKGVIKRKLIIR